MVTRHTEGGGDLRQPGAELAIREVLIPPRFAGRLFLVALTKMDRQVHNETFNYHYSVLIVCDQSDPARSEKYEN